MNQFNNSSPLNLQLMLDAASRKNNYVIAKWFNLASFIWSAIIFLSFLIMTTATVNTTAAEASLYVFMVIVALVNAIVSCVFWLHTKNLVNTVGTAQETGHIAFGVFTFLFANWISGIFILIASSSFNRSQALINLNSQSIKPSPSVEE